METDERLFSIEFGEAVLEDVSLTEIRNFLNEKAGYYEIDRLVRLLEKENRINDKFYLPRIVKKGFQNYWHTPTKEFVENSIHCCFWRTK